MCQQILDKAIFNRIHTDNALFSTDWTHVVNHKNQSIIRPQFNRKHDSL